MKVTSNKNANWFTKMVYKSSKFTKLNEQSASSSDEVSDSD